MIEIGPNLEMSIAAILAWFLRLEEGDGPKNAQGLYVPYQDAAGVWTIAKGHTKGVIASTQPATQQQADAWFAEDQSTLLAIAQTWVCPALEAAMWASLGYNAGTGAMLACKSAGVDHILHYVHDIKGNIEPGLVKRRRDEWLLIQLSRSGVLG